MTKEQLARARKLCKELQYLAEQHKAAGENSFWSVGNIAEELTGILKNETPT